MPSSDIHLNNDKSDFFTDFKNEFVSASILDSFNKLYDTVSWDNKADFAAFTLVPKLGDAKLVETLLYIYENKLSAYHCKEYALVHEEVGSFTISKDEFMRIYPTVSEAEQAFLNFLLISPKLVFEHYSKEYSTSIIPDCFTLYLDTKLHHPAVSALYGMLSLIDVMTDPSIVNSMGTSLQCEDINNAEIFWNQIEIINFGKVGGKQKISSFNQAFRVMQRLAPVWSQLKVSSDTMDEDDYGCVPVKTTPNVEEVVGVYQGNYALVPTTYPASAKICLGLVSNFPNFNRLSKQRKLQVSNYLLNNRAVFNEAISDSCKIITDSIARDCDNMNGLDFSSFDSKTSYILSFPQEAPFCRKSIPCRIPE